MKINEQIETKGYLDSFDEMTQQLASNLSAIPCHPINYAIENFMKIFQTTLILQALLDTVFQ